MTTEASWAAGFFDAEGSTVINRTGPWRRLRVQLPQSAECGGPEILQRFRSAVGGVGTVSGANSIGVSTFYTSSLADALTALEILLPRLGPVKRAQMRRAGEIAWLAMQSGQRPVGPRSVRRRANFERLGRLLITVKTNASEHEVDASSDVARAWAAGLFDGDGNISFQSRRRDGTVAPISLRASVSQSDASGQPWVLCQLKRIVGFGAIYGPFRPDPRCLPGYEWSLGNRPQIHEFVQMLRPYLGTAKLRQATIAIEADEAMPRRRPGPPRGPRATR